MTAALVAMAVVSTLAWHGAAHADDQGPSFKVGVARRAFVPDEPYNWRNARTHALTAAVWYPAAADAVEKPQYMGPPDAPLFHAGRAAENVDIAPAPARFPLIVLSHGTGGAALTMAWLGTALAQHGYVAVAVNHPGNNALEDYTTQGFALWWERAKDLSVVIDRMMADRQFAGRIDPARVGAAGFSLGGYTMIVIAGGITDPAHLDEFCRSAQADTCTAPPEFPDYRAKVAALLQSDGDFQASYRGASQSYRDRRIRAVIAIAPALGPAFRPESLAEIAIPVAIVAGADDPIVPVASSAKYFALHIPRAALTLFPGGVGHYTFLGACTDNGRASLAALCVDRPGIDRDAIHAKTIDLALAFFAANLK